MQHRTGNWRKYKNTSLLKPMDDGNRLRRTFVDCLLQAHLSDLERMCCTGVWDLGTAVTEKSGGHSSLCKRHFHRWPEKIPECHSTFWFLILANMLLALLTCAKTTAFVFSVHHGGHRRPGLAVRCLWMHDHPHKGVQGQCSESGTTSGGPE